MVYTDSYPLWNTEFTVGCFCKSQGWVTKWRKQRAFFSFFLPGSNLQNLAFESKLAKSRQTQAESAENSTFTSEAVSYPTTSTSSNINVTFSWVGLITFSFNVCPNSVAWGGSQRGELTWVKRFGIHSGARHRDACSFATYTSWLSFTVTLDGHGMV